MGVNQSGSKPVGRQTFCGNEVPLNQRQRYGTSQTSRSTQAHQALVVSKRDLKSMRGPQIRQLDHRASQRQTQRGSGLRQGLGQGLDCY